MTTVQDAEMENISLHLRCGSNGSYLQQNKAAEGIQGNEISEKKCLQCSRTGKMGNELPSFAAENTQDLCERSTES